MRVGTGIDHTLELRRKFKADGTAVACRGARGHDGPDDYDEQEPAVLTACSMLLPVQAVDSRSAVLRLILGPQEDWRGSKALSGASSGSLTAARSGSLYGRSSEK